MRMEEINDDLAEEIIFNPSIIPLYESLLSTIAENCSDIDSWTDSIERAAKSKSVSQVEAFTRSFSLRKAVDSEIDHSFRGFCLPTFMPKSGQEKSSHTNGRMKTCYISPEDRKAHIFDFVYVHEYAHKIFDNAHLDQFITGDTHYCVTEGYAYAVHYYSGMEVAEKKGNSPGKLWNAIECFRRVYADHSKCCSRVNTVPKESPFPPISKGRKSMILLAVHKFGKRILTDLLHTTDPIINLVK